MRRAFPIMRGAAEFALDFLNREARHELSRDRADHSPENIQPAGVSLCVGAAMDNQLLRDLFDAIAACGLEGDADFLAVSARLAAA